MEGGDEGKGGNLEGETNSNQTAQQGRVGLARLGWAQGRARVSERRQGEAERRVVSAHTKRTTAVPRTKDTGKIGGGGRILKYESPHCARPSNAASPVATRRPRYAGSGQSPLADWPLPASALCDQPLIGQTAPESGSLDDLVRKAAQKRETHLSGTAHQICTILVGLSHQAPLFFSSHFPPSRFLSRSL